MNSFKRWLPVVAVISIISVVSKLTGRDDFGIRRLLNLDLKYTNSKKTAAGKRTFGAHILTSTSYGAGNPFIRPKMTYVEKNVTTDKTKD